MSTSWKEMLAGFPLSTPVLRRSPVRTPSTRSRATHKVGQAMSLRLYGVVNAQRAEWSEDRKCLHFFMDECRVQEARRRKGLPLFPCKQVGLVEFRTFAETIDPRISSMCLHCPPDAPDDKYCGWEFTMTSSDESTTS